MIFRYKIEIISDIEQKIRKLLVNIAVAPFVGVWVEIMVIDSDFMDERKVAPFVGVWVEICKSSFVSVEIVVAPFVGVWVEIIQTRTYLIQLVVAPFVGVWVEIIKR